MTIRSLLVALTATVALPACVDRNAEEKAAGSSSAALAQSKAPPPARGASSTSNQPITPNRDFTCDTTAVASETILRAVIGAPGEELALDPTERPCSYHLIYKDAHGARKKLLDETALYAIAHAERFFAGTRSETTVVCASPIEHKKAKAPAARASLANRTVESVKLKCAVNRGGDWTEAQDLVEQEKQDGEYAAWVVGVTAAPEKPDTFLVQWVRDSGFQYFNFSDAGRPPTDGVYQTAFSIGKEEEIELGATTRLSTTVAVVGVTAR